MARKQKEEEEDDMVIVDHNPFYKRNGSRSASGSGSVPLTPPSPPQSSFAAASKGSAAEGRGGGGNRRRSRYHSQPKQSFLMSCCCALYKLIQTICICLFVSLVICILGFALMDWQAIYSERSNTINTNSGGGVQVDNLKSNRYDLSFFKTQWEMTKLRAISIYDASTTPLNLNASQDSPTVASATASTLISQTSQTTATQKGSNSNNNNKTTISKLKRQENNLELGQRLFKNGDPVGAETLCKREVDKYFYKLQLLQQKHKQKQKKQQQHYEHEYEEYEDSDYQYYTNHNGNGNENKMTAADSTTMVMMMAEDNREEYIQALICLGNARLALHNTAWNSGLLDDNENENANKNNNDNDNDNKNHRHHNLIFDRLHYAKEHFDIAASLEPTNLQARLGLGLSYFLIATRQLQRQPQQQQQDYDKTFTPLLFNSILHFESISVLASSLSSEKNQFDEEEQRKIETMKIIAMYNNGLAHLALGDIKTAVQILRKVYKFMKKNDDDSILKRGSSVQINLSAALLLLKQQHQQQRQWSSLSSLSSIREAIEMMESSDVLRYCRGTYGNSSGKEGGSEDKFDDSFIDELPYGKQRFLQKQCSIILNNYAIAEEKIRIQQHGNSNSNSASSSQIPHGRSNPEGAIGFFLNGDVGEELFSELSLIYEEKLGLELASFATVNALEKLSLKMRQKIKHVAEYPAPDDKNDISSHEDEGGLEQTVGSYHQWLSLAQTKLNDGDAVGAVNAAAKAVTYVQGLDERTTCIKTLEEALTLMSEKQDGSITTVTNIGSALHSEINQNVDSKSSSESSSIISDDDRVIRLEQELLNLKKQLLQQSVEPSDSEDLESVQHKEGPIVNSNAYGDTKDEGTDQEEFPVLEEVVDSKQVNEVIQNIQNGIMIDETSLPSSETPQVDSQKEAKMESDGKLDTESEFIETTNELEQEVKSNNITTHDENQEIDNIEDSIHSGDDVEDNSTVKRIVENDDEELKENKIEDDMDIENSPDEDGSQIDDTIGLSTANISEAVNESTEEEDEDEEQVVVPELYKPQKKEAGPADQSSLGYMKVADAYIQKENYKLASKQFLKVLKKSPGYIPAILGYATSLERYAKPKQLHDVARAYANVTVHALEQDNTGLAEATFRRSLKVTKSIEGERIDILKLLSTICFNADLAAEIYYELGEEYKKSDTTLTEALKTFKISNIHASESHSSFYSKALYQIAKLTFDQQNKPRKAMELIKSALSQDLGELQVDALVLSGQIKENLVDVTGAIEDYKNAIEFPTSSATATAYYNLGIALKSEQGDSKTIENHIEMALNLGMDLTPEAIEILGEHHIAVLKGIHKKEWKEYQESLLKDKSGAGRSGGIMSGSGVSSESIFSSNDPGSDSSGVGQDALSMLEQGAAAYDGSTVPQGDESMDDASFLANKQERSSSAKVNQEKKLNF